MVLPECGSPSRNRSQKSVQRQAGSEHPGRRDAAVISLAVQDLKYFPQTGRWVEWGAFHFRHYNSVEGIVNPVGVGRDRVFELNVLTGLC